MRVQFTSLLPVIFCVLTHGWIIQHAENGGEFYTGIGYWLDAYDKEKILHLNTMNQNEKRYKTIERNY